MGMCPGKVIRRAGLVKSASGQICMKTYGNIGGELLEAREDGVHQEKCQFSSNTSRGM